MTFLEAAIEILRQAEGPLRVSEITERAVQQKLLSHVGRDPETTMRNSLSSALRSNAHNGLLERLRPGSYQLRAGVSVPDVVVVAAQEQRQRTEGGDGASTPVPATESADVRTRPVRRVSSERVEPAVDEQVVDGESPPKKGSRSKMRDDQESKTTRPEGDNLSSSAGANSELVFKAPSGSGLDGVTDVALVMANAMSRLADERPELREELEAMQQRRPGDAEDFSDQDGEEDVEVSSRSESSRGSRHDASDSEDRNGRKRRRRRRRGKKSEWSAEPVVTQRLASRSGDSLLDKAATVLQGAGTRALHVRQIAEGLAQQKVLNGEISEIERAVTAALILDTHAHGSASRFVLRGDARYQLRGARIPEAAATAEATVRKAIRVLERESFEQLVRWLEGLGARALDALVRIYLERESFSVISSLASGRGITRLLADEIDGEDGPVHTLVLAIPKKANVDARQLESEIDRSNCNAVLAFVMGDPPNAAWADDARLISARSFADWLTRHGVGVETVTFQVPVLNPWIIESIGGLDT